MVSIKTLVECNRELLQKCFRKKGKWVNAWKLRVSNSCSSYNYKPQSRAVQGPGKRHLFMWSVAAFSPACLVHFPPLQSAFPAHLVLAGSEPWLQSGLASPLPSTFKPSPEPVTMWIMSTEHWEKGWEVEAGKLGSWLVCLHHWL